VKKDEQRECTDESPQKRRRRLPTIEEIGGSDPDFTGDVDSVTYIRRMRDGERREHTDESPQGAGGVVPPLGDAWGGNWRGPRQEEIRLPAHALRYDICPVCEGDGDEGETLQAPCPRCAGTGLVLAYPTPEAGKGK